MSEEIDKHKAMNQGNLFITYSLPLPVSYSTPALLFHAWTNQIGKCARTDLGRKILKTLFKKKFCIDRYYCAFGGPEKIFNMFKWCFKHHLCLKYV